MTLDFVNAFQATAVLVRTFFFELCFCAQFSVDCRFVRTFCDVFVFVRTFQVVVLFVRTFYDGFCFCADVSGGGRSCARF